MIPAAYVPLPPPPAHPAPLLRPAEEGKIAPAQYDSASQFHSRSSEYRYSLPALQGTRAHAPLTFRRAEKRARHRATEQASERASERSAAGEGTGTVHREFRCRNTSTMYQRSRARVCYERHPFRVSPFTRCVTGYGHRVTSTDAPRLYTSIRYR